MSYFTNLKSDFNDQINFQINSNDELKVSFINALRRILLTNIPIYGISEKKTQFTKNSSMLDNLFLSHRLYLSPIINDDNLDIENINISLDKKNNSEDIISVYLNDFIVKNGEEIIDNKNFFKYPNILFAKLKPNQEIILNTKLHKGTAKDLGAGLSPVCTAFYHFVYDKNSDDENRERVFDKDKNDNPSKYNFTIESCGNYEPKQLMNKSFEVLKQKLNSIKDDLINKSGEKVELIKSPIVLDAIDINIKNENETIGNLLTKYMINDELKYCGYNIPHPLKSLLVIRISMNDNSKEAISNFVVENIEKLENLIEKVQKNWNSL